MQQCRQQVPQRALVRRVLGGALPGQEVGAFPELGTADGEERREASVSRGRCIPTGYAQRAGPAPCVQARLPPGALLAPGHQLPPPRGPVCPGHGAPLRAAPQGSPGEVDTPG